MTLALFSVGRTCRLVHGDSAVELALIPDGSIDAIVTDPPSGIGFMGKEWDSDRGGRAAWVAWLAGILRECLRVLKPGGHALIWALPRTTHWTACAIEDAGFEIRDRLAWLYGQGFPKSLDISKAIDEHLGLEREVVGSKLDRPGYHLSPNGDDAVSLGAGVSTHTAEERLKTSQITAPASPEAETWEGWGTGLKPACEDWWLARKPFDTTVVENVLAHGTGGINIDGCRIGSEQTTTHRRGHSGDHGAYGSDSRKFSRLNPPGRWPANVVLDEEAARMIDEGNGQGRPGAAPSKRNGIGLTKREGRENSGTEGERIEFAGGGVSRFFYTAKASPSEKSEGGQVDNEHPTVKPIALMQWLIRLITPPGGVVLDPFAGSGTTGIACAAEGFSFIGVELDPKEHATALARLRLSFGEVTA